MKRGLAFLPVMVLALIASGGHAVAASAPAWDIIASSYPTHFAPGATGDKAGPAYLVVATNVGAAPTSGTFTITDSLPGALKPSTSESPSGFYGHAVKNVTPELSCSVAGRTITCTGGGPASVVGPGEWVALTVPVDVEASPPPLVVNKASIEAGGAARAQTTTTTTISAEPASFELVPGRGGLYGSTTAGDGSTPTQAGSHPYQQTVAGMNFSLMSPDIGQVSLVPSGGGIRDIAAELPRGTVVDPQATAVLCTEAELESPTGCPAVSAVGVVDISLALAGVGAGIRPLYNMVPPPGHPASLGFEVLEGTYVHLLGSVSGDGRFQLSAAANDLVAKVAVAGAAVQLWGDPYDESHDAIRGPCALASAPVGGCHVEGADRRAFLTLPSSCGGPLTTTVHVDSWAEPQNLVARSYESTDLEGNPVGIDGCNALAFEPTISAKPTTNQGDSPSGLDFTLHQPQHLGPDELSTANLKDTTVKLPEGMTLNPAAAGGREACSPAQIGLVTTVGQTPIRYREEPQRCPDASKVGTVEVNTPLLDHKLSGAVYLAKPFDNPFGSLLAIYLAVEDEESGIIAKLAGKVTPDPTTGQLTASVEENPELPLEDVKLHFFNGARAPLTTPLVCGEHVTTSTLTPWSTPEGADAHPSGSFQTEAGCYGSEAAAPKAVSFSAGTVSPLSASYSPFVLRLARKDGTQHLTGIETVLPEGLTGRLAGIPYCPEAAIALAKSREVPERGKEEIASPSCPASSEVGTVHVTAGSGISPIPVSGRAYLAGPYKGAPLSLVVIVPAVAGPFDLGTVVDRVALNVGEYDARIHAVADPLPTIRDGIPLDVRSIEVTLGRPGFTLNPTSCETMAIEGQASTQAGQSIPLNNRFQVGECGRLAFKPSLKLSLKGQTRRTGHPALTATVTYPKQGEFANIARAQVSLPHSEFLDQGNIGKACTKTLIVVGACPAKSIYGKAKAWTPLLDAPLEGPVYLVGGYGYKLPALVAELNGQVRLLLVGKVDTGKNKGIRNTFEAVPDAPVEKFVLQMKGGKKYGLLENSENLCGRTRRGAARFIAQNGKVAQLQPRIVNGCKRRKKARGEHNRALR